MTELCLKDRIVALCRDASFEISTHEVGDLACAAPLIAPGTPVSITWAPHDTPQDRIEMALRLRQAGFEPTPHLAARFLRSEAELDRLLMGLRDQAGVRQVIVIAGDRSAPKGPFTCAMDVITSDAFVRCGIRRWGVATYPEGHPGIAESELEAALADKIEHGRRVGADVFAVSQLCFDSAPILRQVCRVRRLHRDAPIRLGLAGPASLGALMKFARQCGVGPSARAIGSRGASLARLLSDAGPDPIIRDLAAVLDDPAVGLHFFSFGGFARTVQWVRSAAAGRIEIPATQSGFAVLT